MGTLKTSRLQVWIMRLCGTRLLCFDCVTGTICEEETWLLRFPSWQWSDLANVLSSCVIKTWALFLSQRKIQIRNPNPKKFVCLFVTEEIQKSICPKKLSYVPKLALKRFGHCSIELCHQNLSSVSLRKKNSNKKSKFKSKSKNVFVPKNCFSFVQFSDSKVIWPI